VLDSLTGIFGFLYVAVMFDTTPYLSENLHLAKTIWMRHNLCLYIYIYIIVRIIHTPKTMD
jgi:hypothetical protein